MSPLTLFERAFHWFYGQAEWVHVVVFVVLIALLATGIGTAPVAVGLVAIALDRAIDELTVATGNWPAIGLQLVVGLTVCGLVDLVRYW